MKINDYLFCFSIIIFTTTTIIHYHHKSMKHSENYNKWRKCYYCRECFQEKDNIGQLYCRIHPGIIFIGNDCNRYYSCCGVRVDSYNIFYNYNNRPFVSQYDTLGCIKIDHFDKEYLMERLSSVDDNESLFENKDIFKRIEQIKSLSIIAVSDQLYNYGVHRPRKECIIDTINSNNCYNINTNYFQDTKQTKSYNLDISKNAFYSHRIKFITPLENDNIQIDLINVCKQIDDMLETNKDYQKDLISNIWTENIATTNTTEEILLIENLKKTIDNTVPRDFQMVKRIDNELVYTYYSGL